MARIEGWDIEEDLQKAINLERSIILNADATTSPSVGVVKGLAKYMDIREDQLKDHKPVFLGTRLKRKVSENSKIDNNIHILFVGRLERRKGIHRLLEVIPEIMHNHNNIILDIVGQKNAPGPDGITYEDGFKNKYGKESWFKRVIFHGPVSEARLQQFYRECDIFVAPSLYESFGLIYTEAWQYEKCVIGSRTGGVPEVVQDGVNGLLAEPDDAGTLKDALLKLINDNDLRIKLGKEGRKRLETELSSEVMTENTIKWYNYVLKKYGHKYDGTLIGSKPNSLSSGKGFKR